MCLLFCIVCEAVVQGILPLLLLLLLLLLLNPVGSCWDTSTADDA
jgi:hypothetical protein